jgi:ribosomal protein S18 acetylase RimI-like enzyme
MTRPVFHIRAMTRAEFDLALDWAAAEGWNPGRFDAEPFYAADPAGLLIGLLGDEAVAVISAIRYGATFGFIGFYIVKPAWRGQGYGWQLWQAAMERLAGRTIGLDGVLAQQDNYRRSGFQLAHRNVRYQGTGAALSRGSALPEGTRLAPLASLPFDALLAYDRAFFPAVRAEFLQRWIGQPQSLALGLLSGTQLLGYGVRRACRDGHKIGPLFADSPEAAAALFDALCAQIEADAPDFLDVPECNPAAIAMAEARGMVRVFETARMYTGAAPDLALARSYGITSFELG